MAGECAYCGKPAKFTREHIWPDCILDRIPPKGIRFSHKTKTAHGGDYTIRDVCEKCNNVRLSPLDTYFCNLYDKYFAVAKGENEVVDFQYDYHLLLRTLLKLSYNSARAGFGDDGTLARTVPYILGTDLTRPVVSLLAQLATTTSILSVDPDGQVKTQVFAPQGIYRLAVLQTSDGGLNERFLIRLVGVNSFRFFLVLPRTNFAIIEYAEAVSRISGFLGCDTLIECGSRRVVLRTSSKDALSDYLPEQLENRKTYEDYLDKVLGGSGRAIRAHLSPRWSSNPGPPGSPQHSQ
jgi:hypothetical protein